MAQEHAILLWCDLHEDDKISADTITINGLTAEICPTCSSRYSLTEIMDLLENIGRNGNGKPRKKKAEQVEIDLMCPFGCEHKKNPGGAFSSPRGLKMHISREHPDGAESID